jgi:hypothetical protein
METRDLRSFDLFGDCPTLLKVKYKIKDGWQITIGQGFHEPETIKAQDISKIEYQYFDERLQ